MSGEKNLELLLKTMKPAVNEGEYVFCTLPGEFDIPIVDIISFFREAEGISIVIRRTDAELLSLKYDYVASWITLTVHSSLEAVGLTARIANVLAGAQISCNVIAAYYHDHIFVDQKDCNLAMKILEDLSKAQS